MPLCDGRGSSLLKPRQAYNSFEFCECSRVPTALALILMEAKALSCVFRSDINFLGLNGCATRL